MEIGLSRDRRILIPILDYIGEHAPLTREQIRVIIKELNLILSVRNIAVLNFDEIKALLEEIDSPAS
ncbi:hypothetical protein HYW42_00850 [Candidatus Daviesbacteria bacterium]|nr:hypothetical protein [Candidatus Daviesbacteria bacterium]